MPSFRNFKQSEILKILYFGHSGAGKTGSLASLAAAGYNVRILDLDRGVEILNDYVNNPKSIYLQASPKGLWTAEQGKTIAERISYVTITETYKTRGLKASPCGDSYGKVLKQLDNWIDGDAKLGPISSWGPNDVLVIDGLSRLTESIMNFQLSLNGRLESGPQIGNSGGNDYTAAFKMTMDLLDLLKSSAVNCNVIMICHIQYQDDSPLTTGDPKNRVMKGFPQIVGKKIAPQVAQYFNHSLRAKSTGDGNFVKRVIVTNKDEAIDLKNVAPMRVKAEYPLDTGLAEYFAAIKGNMPGGTSDDR